MLLFMDGLAFQHRLGALVILLLTQRCAGQSQVLGPSQPVLAAVGGDVLLPCQLETAADASDMTVEWSRQDLHPRFVYIRRDGVELERKKNPAYEGRSSLSVNKLTHGDISLKLSGVKLSDEGKYRCFVPTLGRESAVELVVGAVSFIVLSLERSDTDGSVSGVVLQCESAGWYPEPEVLWLDAEGNLLSAGPAETLRGPDGLYTVSSRVTVQQRGSSSFTCRVQQNNINQSRETHIHVPDDVFVACCSSGVHITVVLAVGFSLTVAVLFVVLKWRHNRTRLLRDFKEECDQEVEQEVQTEAVTLLEEHKKQLESLRDKLQSQLEEVEKEQREKTTSASVNTSRYYILCQEAAKAEELEKRKAALEECLQKAEEQVQTADGVIRTMTAGNERLKEMKRQKGDSQGDEGSETSRLQSEQSQV